MKLAIEILIFIALGWVLFSGIDVALMPPPELKNHFLTKGVKETGAVNLVSSIYLGYRAFDTLGETVVLLLAVSGIMMIFEVKK